MSELKGVVVDLAKIAKHAKEALRFGVPALNKAIRILLANLWNGLPEMADLIIAFFAIFALFARVKNKIQHP